MAKKDIKFDCEVKGAVSFEISIQKKRIVHATNKIKYAKKMEADTLNVDYLITGPNGSDYSIIYSCKSDGVAKSDADKPTPVEGTIEHNGISNETLTIKL